MPGLEGLRAGIQALTARPGRLQIGLGALFLLLVVANAWVDEDAYISFRSALQLLTGNGPRWNPHERVQAFTHPLWLGCLTGLTLVVRDPYVAALVASLLGCVAMLFGLRRALAIPRDAAAGPDGASDAVARFALVLLALATSKSFFDFTTSGLENPLAYALLAFQLAFCFRALAPSTVVGPTDVTLQSLLLGALLLTRHDLLLLAGPMYVALLRRCRHLGAHQLLRASLLGLAPFVLWTAFSLVYYGFPFPNTAYAKLATGIPRAVLVEQGLRYLESLAIDDPLALAVLVVAIGAGFLRPGPGERAIALGLLATSVYVVAVGGDYMTGRFFSSATLVGVVVIGRRIEASRRTFAVAAAGVIACALLLPGSPITSGPHFTVDSPNTFGIGDQRGIFFQTTSLRRWLARDRDAPFPDHRWSRAGRALAASGTSVMVGANVGFMGYHAGTEKIIIDRLALTDPLLARLPAIPLFRIGHFPRRLPEGYVEGVTARRDGTAAVGISDPALRAFHEQLRLVTEGDLFSRARLIAIVRLNLGLGPGRSAGARDGKEDATAPR